MHRKTPGPLEARPAVMAVGAEHGRQGRHCRLRAEHFAHLPDVKGRGNEITRHPAPHNGNNCVTGRQFPAPFDSSDTRWIQAGGSPPRCRLNEEGHKCEETDVDGARLPFFGGSGKIQNLVEPRSLTFVSNPAKDCENL